MNELDKIIQSLLEAVSNASNTFNTGMDAIQQNIFDDVSLLVKNLDISNGKLDNTVNNIKAIGAVKSKIEKIVLNPDYIDAVKNYISAFDDISKLQDSYFRQLSSVGGPKKLLEAIKQQSVEYTVSSLTESGISANVSDGIREILKRNITGNATYSELLDQMRNYILTNESGTGALERYTKQITTDSLQQFSRQYGQVISSDLDLEWFMYVGSNRATSREFCILLTKKKYIHRSELGDIVNGIIDGVQIYINPKTNVWAGGIPGTNVNNLQIVCGGYSCEHSMYPISSELVPEWIKNKLGVPPAPAAKEEPPPAFKNEKEMFLQQYDTQKEKLLKDYLKTNGNVVNTDLARKQFDGYNGINADAVHPAAQNVALDALAKLIKDGTNNYIAMLGGGPGAGKTTSIGKVLPSVADSADAIIDSNMASYKSASARLDEYLGQNKSVSLTYVYRDPVDAWVNGVINRMLNDPEEMGRVVPISKYIQLTIGSYDTYKAILEKGTDLQPNVQVTLIDNSRGYGNAEIMSKDKFNSISFPSDLKETLLRKTKDLFDKGILTQEQYDALIQ